MWRFFFCVATTRRDVLPDWNVIFVRIKRNVSWNVCAGLRARHACLSDGSPVRRAVFIEIGNNTELSSKKKNTLWSTRIIITCLLYR